MPRAVRIYCSPHVPGQERAYFSFLSLFFYSIYSSLSFSTNHMPGLHAWSIFFFSFIFLSFVLYMWRLPDMPKLSTNHMHVAPHLGGFLGFVVVGDHIWGLPGLCPRTRPDTAPVNLGANFRVAG